MLAQVISLVGWQKLVKLFFFYVCSCVHLHRTIATAIHGLDSCLQRPSRAVQMLRNIYIYTCMYAREACWKTGAMLAAGLSIITVIRTAA